MKSWFITCIGIACVTVYGNPPKDIAAKVLPDVVLLTVQDAHGLPITQGSGFFISENEIVTNHHVLAGGARVSAKIVGQNTEIEIKGVISADEARDLALLEAVTVHPSHLALAKTEPAVGDEIYVAGNPGGLEGTFSNGLVSGKRFIEGVNLLQITAPISPGSSGGPIVNSSGEVVGVTVATLRFGQNLNFALPIDQLASLTRSAPRPVADVFGNSRSPAVSSQSGSGGEFISADGLLSAYALMTSGRHFSFTIKNNQGVPVVQVHYLVIAYDSSGRPLDHFKGWFSQETIPAGLAKRVSGNFSENTPASSVQRYEIRLLDYNLFEPGKYVVRPGDTLSKIARKNGVSIDAMLKANPEMDPAHLRVGQRLTIP